MRARNEGRTARSEGLASLGSDRGFTLVEMLIVVVLVGAAVGFGIEGLRTYRETQRAHAGAVQVVTVLNHAKSRAVTMNRPVIVDLAPGGLNPSDGFYQVYADTDGDATLDAGEVAAANLAETTERSGMVGYQLPAAMGFGQPQGASTGPLGITAASDGVSFTNNQVTLLPDGTATEAGHLMLFDDDDRAYAVTLTAGGAVRMYRFDGSGWR